MQNVFTKRVIVTVIIAIVVSCGVYLWQLFIIPSPVTEYYFTVAEKEDIHDIARNLKKEGIIKHRTYYYFTHFIFGMGSKPEPGIYKLSTGMKIRQMVWTLGQDPWAEHVTIPPGLTKEGIGEIIGDRLKWGTFDRQYFALTYAGMQWQQYHDELEEVFTDQYQWNDKKAETFLTLSALYSDSSHDFFKNMYEPGTYTIPLGSSRAQAAGILIDQFVTEREKEGMSSRSALVQYIDKKAMNNVSKLIEEEMVLMPDIVAIPPLDLTLKKTDGRTYLHFTTSYWNKGRGPLEFIPDRKTIDTKGDVETNVYQRIYELDGGYTEKLSGTFLWHEPHHHYHYKDFATYSLTPADSGPDSSGQSASQKSTFCIRDYNPIDLSHPGANKDSSYKVCGRERQGISPGWADSYYYTYVDQKFDVTDFSPGKYRLNITINPESRFEEITKNNNVGEVILSLDVEHDEVRVLEEKQYGI